MASRGKKKTTMAKLSREARLRERRIDKQARKEARRDAALIEPPRAGAPSEAHSSQPGG
jgi:tRNA/tmRNA/rRNA uracil-C5-methylase (TrmA/RlmC/RlmD family)